MQTHGNNEYRREESELVGISETKSTDYLTENTKLIKDLLKIAKTRQENTDSYRTIDFYLKRPEIEKPDNYDKHIHQLYGKLSRKEKATIKKIIKEKYS